jgi:hypothetical protein
MARAMIFAPRSPSRDSSENQLPSLLYSSSAAIRKVTPVFLSIGSPPAFADTSSSLSESDAEQRP